MNSDAFTDYHAATVDDFIDVIMKDHRKYIKWYILQTIDCYLPLITNS